MKNSLVLLLLLTSIVSPVFKEIDSYSDSNTKFLVINESINTFNIEGLYKVEC